MLKWPSEVDHSRSLEMASFDRLHTSFYWRSVVTMASYCICSEIKRDTGQKSRFFSYPTCIRRPRRQMDRQTELLYQCRASILPRWLAMKIWVDVLQLSGVIYCSIYRPHTNSSRSRSGRWHGWGSSNHGGLCRYTAEWRETPARRWSVRCRLVCL